jgi:hypothetical protein
VKMTAATPRRDGRSLVGWLGLLGWHVEIERIGAQWTGTAQRLTVMDDGARVSTEAESYRDVVSELYRGALSLAA